MFVERRKAIVKQYNEAFLKLPQIVVQKEIPESDTTRHLCEQRRVLAALEQLLRDEDRAGKVQRLRLVVKRALHDHQVGVERI